MYQKRSCPSAYRHAASLRRDGGQRGDVVDPWLERIGEHNQLPAPLRRDGATKECSWCGRSRGVGCRGETPCEEYLPPFGIQEWTGAEEIKPNLKGYCRVQSQSSTGEIVQCEA